jgi:hypothetical protein
MSERIKELVKQSMVEYQFDMRFSPEKFAELIVKECADWIDSQDESRCPYGIDLLEHFGVKE